MTVVINSAAIYTSIASRKGDSDSKVNQADATTLSFKRVDISSSSSSVSSPSLSDINEDTVSITKSRREARAMRSLSEGASYINMAEDALINIDSLLEELNGVSDKIDKEPRFTQKEALGEEGQLLLDEIDRISKETIYNEKNIFSNEPLTVTANLNGKDFSSSSSVSVSIPGLFASLHDLGLSDLSATLLKSSPSQTKELVTDAQSTIREQLSSLNSARTSLQQSVTSYGQTHTKHSQQTPEKTLNNIINNLTTQFAIDNHQLTASHTQTLLIF